MVQAVFDRGYFTSIQIKNMKGKILITKRLASEQGTVPQWFERLISWPSAEKSALVMDGWRQVGVVLVTSDPSYVYHSLWKNAVEMVKAYWVFALISLFLVYAFIQYLLKPLKRVTAQALAISEHEFPIEEKIPSTPELKQVTLAMNHMVIKIKSLFQEQLQQTELFRVQAYQDNLTGLSNRRYFVQQLTAILDNEDEFIPGYVLMIVIDGLDELNQQEGYQQGDDLIITIAKTCKEFWKRESISTLARISGSTFVIINHERDPLLFVKECGDFEKIIKSKISHYPLCDAHMGAAKYFTHQSVSNLLTMLDLAVKRAIETEVFYCQLDHDTFKYPQVMNAEKIAHSIEQKHLSLYRQAVTNSEQSLHQEIFIRIREPMGEELGAGYFMPVAEKLGVAYEIDLFVLEQLAKNSEERGGSYAVNISEDTVLNNREEYLQRLKKLPKHIVKHLSLEISESLILEHFAQAKSFAKAVKKLGVGIGIDKVGMQFSPLHYLVDLHIDY